MNQSATIQLPAVSQSTEVTKLLNGDPVPVGDELVSIFHAIENITLQEAVIKARDLKKISPLNGEGCEAFKFSTHRTNVGAPSPIELRYESNI